MTLQEEQVAILREKSDKDKVLTWADTKKMPITSRVIQETLRVASILSFTFREAVEDVEFEGWLPPKLLTLNVQTAPISIEKKQKNMEGYFSQLAKVVRALM